MLTFRVQPRFVPCFLAGVDMDPSLLLVRIDLGEDMIFGIPHPSHPTANGTTQHAEAVGPFPTAAPSCLEQSPDISVSRKSLVRPAVACRTSIEFYASGPSCRFIWLRWCHTQSHGRRRADRARRIVDKCEERTLEPSTRTIRFLLR